MEIRARDANRELLLEFSGDIDHHGARNALKEVEMAIDAALPRLLILDFSGVTFMDSSGIGCRRDRSFGFHQVKTGGLHNENKGGK